MFIQILYLDLPWAGCDRMLSSLAIYTNDSSFLTVHVSHHVVDAVLFLNVAVGGSTGFLIGQVSKFFLKRHTLSV